MSLIRLFHTIRFLTVEQICFQLYYKFCALARRFFGRKVRYVCYRKGYPVNFLPFPLKKRFCYDNGQFSFLNVCHKFDGAWDDASHGDLWRYNLNYMDFLLQPSMSAVEGCKWILCFIESIKYNAIAEDPYPLSLRGINWIKFLSLHKNYFNEEHLKKIDTSLYSQYKLLSRRTERHLMANHYLENGFSLLFGAVYFRDERFWVEAKGIIERQLQEQIMPDGAHFELSPMYHCVILERMLDCYNILQSSQNEIFRGSDALISLIRSKTEKMLGWLDAILLIDGSIPLLNDSAKGIALGVSELRAYARRLGIEWSCGKLKESGYRHFSNSVYEAVIDVAPLGVGYNLGHSHADTFTFLLWSYGKGLVVDTGVSTYATGARREYERSTAAHNTVVVNGKNSSNVWGAFRCAQRANVTVIDEKPEYIKAVHDGYLGLGVRCARTFTFLADSMQIVDEIHGNAVTATAFFHLAPGISILEIKDDVVVTDKAVFSFKGCSMLSVEKASIAEEYNILLDSDCLSVKFSGRLQTIINEFK